MYRLDEHAWMVSDGVRMGAYQAALRRAVHPGCTVLDIGTGMGIFALLAAKLGASRVYAIEPSEIIYAAEWIARDNGLDDRIRRLGLGNVPRRLHAESLLNVAVVHERAQVDHPGNQAHSRVLPLLDPLWRQSPPQIV